MDFILVSNTACTFIDCDGAIENCKTYDSDFRGYTPSSGTWSISSGTITAGVIAGYTFVGWYTITSGTYGTVDSATIRITTSRNISYSQISSAGTYGISGLAFVCAKYQKNPGVSLLSCGAKCTIGGMSVPSGVYDHYLPDYKGYTYGSSYNYPYAAYLTRTGYDITVSNIEDGYEFIGWYTSNTKSSSVVFDSADDATKLLTTSTSVNDSYLVNNAGYYTRGGTRYYVAYAKFKRKPITCTYDGMGGPTPSRATDTLDIGGTFPTLPTVPSITGWTFNGWYTSAIGGTKINSGDTVTQTSDFTLYAHWTPNTYTVTLNPNGGSSGTSSVTATYSSAMPSATMPTRPGYTFQGFYDTSSSTGGNQYYTLSGASARTWDKTYNATLYARWTPNKYTVIFNANGGETPSPSSKTVTYKSTYGTLATVSRLGYGFLGWFTDPTSGTKVNSTDTYNIIGNQTLYAHWIGNELVVTYDPNGGTSERYFDRVRIGGTFPALPTATWGSDTTSRWYTSPTGGTEIHEGDTVTQTKDFTLYAHWDRTETCTVTFNAGEGIASETQRTVNKGAAIGALPTATWTGHTFKGWFLSSGGGTAIASAYVVDDDLYLYAQWDSETYTVTFNGNGGTPSQSTKSVAYGSQYGTLPYCNQTSKTFLGWFTSATGGTKVEATTIFNQQSNQTLYAHWSDVDPAVKWYYLVSP